MHLVDRRRSSGFEGFLDGNYLCVNLDIVVRKPLLFFHLVFIGQGD